LGLHILRAAAAFAKCLLVAEPFAFTLRLIVAIMADASEKVAPVREDAPTKQSTIDSQDLERSDSDSFKQDGVKGVEAITSVWTKKALYITLGL
jgi:hypothetical protein